MLASAEKPRPLPPAKARRKANRRRMTTSSTPPPAYGSPCDAFPRKDLADDYVFSVSTISDPLPQWNIDPTQPPPDLGDDDCDDNLAWYSERSRDELAQLLVKADDIIKERENGSFLLRLFV